MTVSTRYLPRFPKPTHSCSGSLRSPREPRCSSPSLPTGGGESLLPFVADRRQGIRGDLIAIIRTRAFCAERILVKENTSHKSPGQPSPGSLATRGGARHQLTSPVGFSRLLSSSLSPVLQNQTENLISAEFQKWDLVIYHQNTLGSSSAFLPAWKLAAGAYILFTGYQILSPTAYPSQATPLPHWHQQLGRTVCFVPVTCTCDLHRVSGTVTHSEERFLLRGGRLQPPVFRLWVLHLLDPCS